jgi:hypothetical protein
VSQAVGVTPPYVPFPQQPREAAVGDLADGQHGVVTLGQLRTLGLSGSAVSKRVAKGSLYRVYRGVYSVRHRSLGYRGRWMAAVLSCGASAALSHRSGAAHIGLRPSDRAGIDVSVPRGFGTDRPGIDLHRTGTLAPQDVHEVDGIRCTSVARTLVDLGDVLPARAVERAVEQAEILRVFDATAVDEVLGRAGPRRGAGVLRAVLGEGDGETLTANDLEELFLRICRDAGLPKPAANAWLVAGDRVAKADFLWRKERLIAETDGRETHGTPQAFESDRERDQWLAVAGYRVVRFSHRRVTDQPRRVAATVGALLGQ